MKKIYRLTSMFLLAAVLVSGCGNKAAVEVNGVADMKPVDSYLTKEVREYKDEGTVETPVSTLSSEDGLCVIKVMPSYYDVTLDYEKGDRASVGKAYGSFNGTSAMPYRAIAPIAPPKPTRRVFIIYATFLQCSFIFLIAQS